MATVRITEAELALDVGGVLKQVQEGGEVIVERENHQALALIRRLPPISRNISECIALAKAYEQEFDSAPVPDSDFDRDVQKKVDAQLEPIYNVWDD